MSTDHPIPARNFWLALGAQLLLIAAVPAQALYTLNTGTTVYLKTAPVDPVDLLRGYYQTLGYEISNKDTLQKLSGGGFMMKVAKGQEIFVTLALPAIGERTAAKPIAVSFVRPPTKPQEVVLRGVYNGWQLKYDLEQFYMPEQQQAQVNQDIDRGRRAQNLLMETKIGQDGRGVPVAIWIGDRSYRF